MMKTKMTKAGERGPRERREPKLKGRRRRGERYWSRVVSVYGLNNCIVVVVVVFTVVVVVVVVAAAAAAAIVVVVVVVLMAY